MADKHFYFCTECKKHLGDIHELLFIEDVESKGFCSVECAEDFYYPIVRYFKDFEIKIRKDNNLPVKEDNLIDHKEFLANIYTDPQSVYRYQNALGERLHIFIRKFKGAFGVSVAHLYQGDISLVLASFVTQHEALINEFKIGEDITSHYLKSLKEKLQSNEQVVIQSQKDQELIVDLESKKSSVLAEILGLIKSSDIQIEEYFHYDYCFEDTFSHADEVYQFTDNFGDKMEYFIKTYPQENLASKSFYYIVIALRVKSETNSSLYPILGFPTIDLEIYQEFSRGKKISVITFN